MEKSGDLRNVVMDRCAVQPPVTYPTHHKPNAKSSKYEGGLQTTNLDFV